MIYLVAEVNKVNEFHGLSFRNLLNVIFEKKKKLHFYSVILKPNTVESF